MTDRRLSVEAERAIEDKKREEADLKRRQDRKIRAGYGFYHPPSARKNPASESDGKPITNPSSSSTAIPLFLPHQQQ